MEALALKHSPNVSNGLNESNVSNERNGPNASNDPNDPNDPNDLPERLGEPVEKQTDVRDDADRLR